MSKLRTKQRALARDEILGAAAALVGERRHLDFSLQEVADRAGVSLRTVYNHFASREDLLDGVNAHVSALMSDPAIGAVTVGEIASVDDLERAVRANFAIFERFGGLSEALAQMSVEDARRSAERERRTEAFRALGAVLLPDLGPDDAARIALLLRHLISHRSWFALTRDYGMTTPEAAAHTTWAVRALVAAARGGDLPPATTDAAARSPAAAPG